MLPKGLAVAVARIIADAKAEWRREIDRLGADARDALTAAKAETEILRAELEALQSQFKSVVAEVEHAKVEAEARPPAADIEALVKSAVSAALTAVDRPAHLGPDLEALQEMVDQTVAKAVEAMPAPKDGEKGDPGATGPQGDPGPAGVSIRDLSINEAGTLVVTMSDESQRVVGRVVGRDGKDGEKGAPGAVGPQGDPGPAGVGVAGAVIDRAGDVIVTLSDGTHANLGRVVGRDGEPGLGFDDMTVELADDGRTIVLAFRQGERCREFRLAMPVIIYRGVWTEGAYRQGDSVTRGGSQWIAMADTTDQPGTSDAWVLSVKKGRDGRSGEVKARPDPEPLRLR